MDWYDQVKDGTIQLVRIKSQSPGAGERAVAARVVELLRAGDLADAYDRVGLDALPEDEPYQRQNAYAFLRGRSPRTVVLLGHIDTVGTEDYGTTELQELALDPLRLDAARAQLEAVTPGLADDLAASPDDWLLGRGVMDMKSGVAANIAVMRRLARQRQEGGLALSVVLLATPDEENESAGILQAVRWLLSLRADEGLEYLGAINTDYTTSRYPDDPNRYAYAGSIGKLLPSFLVVGRESHVGDPFDGLDANLLAAELIRDLSMNDELCDVVDGQATPPPVTLHAADLKDHYDVQLPFAAHFYLNVLTFSTTPGELLERLRARAEAALQRVLGRIDEAEQRWVAASGAAGRVTSSTGRSGSVLHYAELHCRAIEQQGEAAVEAALERGWQSWVSDAERRGWDSRQRSLHLVRLLWDLSGQRGPAVVIYYSPPYYPHAAGTPSELRRAVETVANEHADLALQVAGFYPFISDMSYLRLDLTDPMSALAPLTANMPLWCGPGAPERAGGYSLPLREIHELGLPFVNLGPYGRGAHQRGERVLKSYSFGVLPELIYGVIERLA
jgi:arginine utilization protein RocB